MYCYVLGFLFRNLEFREIYQPQMKHYYISEWCVHLKNNSQKKNRNYMNTMENRVVYDINR